MTEAGPGPAAGKGKGPLELAGGERAVAQVLLLVWILPPDCR